MQRVLLLNANGEPLGMVTWTKALKLVFRGKVRVYEYYQGETIRSATQEILLPSVIGLVRYVVIPGSRKVGLNRKNLLIRDGYTCQYCKKELTSHNGTVDHLVPLSRGGQTQWENVVAACKPCNHKKANRTVEESGMHPARRPWVPNRVVIIREQAEQMGYTHWRPYFSMVRA